MEPKPHDEATGGLNGSASDETATSKPDRRKAYAAMGITVVVLVIVFGVILPQLVDWNVVFDVLRGVDGLSLAVIFGLGLIRYFPGGWIYSIVLPGLSIPNGTRAWVASTGVSSTLPGFDLVLRLAMYTSWGFRIEQASSGMFLSGIAEMTARLTVATGALLIWGLIKADIAVLAIVAIGGVVLAGVVFLVISVLRSEERARLVGARIERIVRWVFTKFKRQAPDDVIDRVLGVRLEARDVLGRRWPIALAAAFLGQAIAYTMLFTSIRAVGIDSSILSWSDILVGQAVVALITLIPITPGSVGIAGLAFVGVYTAIAGKQYSDLIAAGVILYRLAVWLLPIPIGWLVAFRWQSKTGNRLFGAGAEA